MKRKKVHPYCKKRIAWRLRNQTTPQQLSELLLMTVSYDVPIDVLEARTPLERAQAEEWAAQVHLSASDNAFVRIPARPDWLACFDVDEVALSMPDLEAMPRSDFLGPDK